MRFDREVMKGLAALVLALASFSAWATPTTSYYVFDESGHVIGEYDANGNAVQEHVYLGDRPVAVVQGGSSGTVDYVSTDQLNYPRVVTDQNQTVLWTWNSDPFGNGTPIGSLAYNLRFPGQYYDAETGHNYNYHRDYDPSVGRYIESDPLDLQGGVNTYGYVNGNPIGLSDSRGEFFDATGAFFTAVETAVEASAATAAAAAAGVAAAFYPTSTANDELTPCQQRDDKCRKAIADAERAYNELRFRSIPQYMYASNHNEADDGHLEAIRQGQAALADAIRRVKLYCTNPPPELDQWEQLANQDFPSRH